jgi:hypothetical protein
MDAVGFRISFTPLAGVLLTVPSRYTALSVTTRRLSWSVVRPAYHGIARGPWYSRSCARAGARGVRDSHPLWCVVPDASPRHPGAADGVSAPSRSLTTPHPQGLTAWHGHGLDGSPVRSPLLRAGSRRRLHATVRNENVYTSSVFKNTALFRKPLGRSRQRGRLRVFIPTITISRPASEDRVLLPASSCSFVRDLPFQLLRTIPTHRNRSRSESPDQRSSLVNFPPSKACSVDPRKQADRSAHRFFGTRHGCLSAGLGFHRCTRCPPSQEAPFPGATRQLVTTCEQHNNSPACADLWF